MPELWERSQNATTASKIRGSIPALHVRQAEGAVLSPNKTPVTELSGNGKLVYGCDYNPEQWDSGVWQEDVRLMKKPASTL